MSQKTHTTAVVIIPPRELWPPIQAIRQQYDRQIRRWMPHITLLYPFRPRAEFPMLVERFAQQCAKFQAFTLTLKKFCFFRHKREHYTLWLAPEPQTPLIQLQTELWSMVPDCDDVRNYPHGFTPHLSVGQVQGQETVWQLQNILHRSWQPVSFMVNEISFIWRKAPPDDVFQVAQTIKLSS